ncbi:hypothetical protein J0A67_11920 [Algoriphagus aestuariicola]|uniref:Uncharacterized protein n=1 Tax=Algoriphagus aestuariicola TaxID=1852016 RepID=A0ABS3BQK6_9BACT|nr:hypothetical protein [Algoriphagus aestuariicola]MBN7801572.1 hypothetical protein [Algoriphagus aestuariicola]
MEGTKKLFSQRAISIATYFGGPAAAGYLVKKNYEAYNQEDNGKKAFIIGIISTFVVFVGIFSIPEPIIDKIPNALIPAIYSGIIYLIVERIQGQWLKEHKESGGEFFSGWKATGIGAIFMVILLALIMGSVFVEGELSQSDFDTVAYDKEIERFVENESTSLAVFSVIDTSEPQYLMKEFSKGIVLWNENKEIVKGLNSIDNLPAEFIEQNKLLLKYCDLRIQHSEIILKAINEDTDKYVAEIDRIGVEIEKILEELQ